MRRLNAYVGKERIHCFLIVRPIAMTQMRLSRWSGATEIQNNSSLLVIKRTIASRVFLDFGLETQGFERVWAQIGCCEVCEHRRQLQSSKWEEKSIICARNAIFGHCTDWETVHGRSRRARRRKVCE